MIAGKVLVWVKIAYFLVKETWTAVRYRPREVKITCLSHIVSTTRIHTQAG